LVEHTTENRGVPGSSPGLAITTLQRQRSGARGLALSARITPAEGAVLP
jgi:hypothetical protein